MGFSEKPPHQSMEGGFESEGKKWVIAGISLRAPLKPVRTTNSTTEKEQQQRDTDIGGDDGGEEYCSTTTPTAEEARIPTKLTCPPAPRKRKPVSRCNYSGVREFFTPPDLETVFIRHVERAN